MYLLTGLLWKRQFRRALGPNDRAPAVRRAVHTAVPVSWAFVLWEGCFAWVLTQVIVKLDLPNSPLRLAVLIFALLLFVAAPLFLGYLGVLEVDCTDRGVAVESPLLALQFRLMAGDMTVRGTARSQNEIGQMSRTGTVFFEWLDKSVERVTTSVTAIVNGGDRSKALVEDQSSLVNETAGAVEQLARNIESLDKALQNQKTHIQTTSNSLSAVVGSIHAIESDNALTREAFAKTDIAIGELLRPIKTSVRAEGR
jgi:hypothetical protein